MNVWYFVVIPIAVTIIGSVFAAFRNVPPLVRSGLQHFTAGAVFAALAGELLPDVLDRHMPLATVTGFVIGVVVMFALSRWGGREEEDGHQAATGVARTSKSATAVILAVAVDALLDGLVIGISFTAGQAVGMLVTIALSLEMFFLGVTTAIALRERGASSARASVITCALALLIGVGAALGMGVFAHLPPAALAGTLAFGCAALLYLVTEELLVEAHSVKETPFVTSLFFAGFLALLIVELLM